jgi:hypothetical protein
MKQFKSDGRYKYYGSGLHYIVEFRWANAEDKLLFVKLHKVFAELYGPEKEKVQREGYSYPVWQLNQEWRSEQNRNARRRRIYLKEESVLSLALLRIG